MTVLFGCSSGHESHETDSFRPFQELYQQGIDKYLGVFVPDGETTTPSGATQYLFDPEKEGPLCYTGNQFSMFTRDGSSQKLLIFLQGGGFCAPEECDAVRTGIPFFSLGILDPSDAANPAAQFNVGYVPYCDGSVMIGDNEVDSDGDGINDRFFTGAKNLSASLDVIYSKYPSPSKIVLAGNSAGGFGVHAALPLVRKLYPGVNIDMNNDSGIGILPAGAWRENLDYWNARDFFPTSCSECLGENGKLTEYYNYQLNEDPGFRLAFISAKQDATFAAFLEGGGTAFEAQLREVVDKLKMAFPERFNSLLADGDEHTFLISDFDYDIAGTTVKAWISDMLNSNPAWRSLAD